MGFEKIKLMNDLIDLYGVLLTDNQLKIMEYHYMDDLSLAEISENLNITRSAVFDTIKKSENILIGYEEKLKLLYKENLKKEILENAYKYSKEELIEQFKNI